MAIRNISVAWDVPVPEGYGRSNRWRVVRTALNTMLADRKSQVTFSIGIDEKTTEEEAVRIASLCKAAYYSWRTALGKSGNVSLPEWRTAYEITKEAVNVFVYSPEKATYRD